MLKKFNKLPQRSLRNLIHVTPLKLEKSVKCHYYEHHNPVSTLEKEHFPRAPYTDTSIVEKIKIDEHIPPKNLGDKVAYYTMLFLRQVVHLVFRDRYSHHAVVLETVAAVPPMSKNHQFKKIKLLAS
jgi:hypothetical protein